MTQYDTDEDEIPEKDPEAKSRFEKAQEKAREMLESVLK